MSGLDNYFGIHAKALLIREQRADQIAHNISNVNTPHYQAKDIDFAETLGHAMQNTSSQMVTNHPAHINASSDFSAQLKYRVSNDMGLDGNNVDKNLETVEFTKNALSYQASLGFINSKIKTLMTALRGE